VVPAPAAVKLPSPFCDLRDEKATPPVVATAASAFGERIGVFADAVRVE
jgi:hypothetical protein